MEAAQAFKQYKYPPAEQSREKTKPKVDDTHRSSSTRRKNWSQDPA
jgi:hypothetical protein